jgi:hypothetical protein
MFFTILIMTNISELKNTELKHHNLLQSKVCCLKNNFKKFLRHFREYLLRQMGPIGGTVVFKESIRLNLRETLATIFN